MFGLFGGGKDKDKSSSSSSSSSTTTGGPSTFSEMADMMAQQVQSSSSSSSSPSSRQQQQQAGGGGSGGSGGILSFDPSGLERAAKAVRELDGSRNAQAAIDIARAQEATRQLERQAQIREYEAHLKQAEVERVRVEQEERRKTLELETSHYNYRAKQQDDLARKRQQEKLAAEKQLQDELLRRQEESTLRQESMKRETIEYEAKLKRDNDKARVAAETEGKIRYERENHDIHTQDLKLQAAEYRETTLAAIRAAGDTIGKGFQEFITDGDKVFASVSALSLLALGVYTAKVSTGVIGRFIEVRLGKPSLVRETSKRSLFYPLLHPIKISKELLAPRKGAMDNIVLSEPLQNQLRTVEYSTLNANRNRAPYRHLLLYGPPGTGKTMFAKSLAKNSGMDYAIMTGGDVAPLGRDSVTEIHKLFDWAQHSRRGLLLFVDEADAFLRKRDKVEISENMRNALNSFLYRTGESSKKLMVVLASNQPQQLDRAINDRMDEMVHFDLPAKQERKRILEQYFKQYLIEEPKLNKSAPIQLDGVSVELMEEIAAKTKGFSGRELSKLAIAWQATAYASPKTTLTREMLEAIVNSYVEQHAQREGWHRL